MDLLRLENTFYFKSQNNSSMIDRTSAVLLILNAHLFEFSHRFFDPPKTKVFDKQLQNP